MKRKHRIGCGLVTALLSLLFTIAAGEIIIRLSHAAKARRDHGTATVHILDDKLGWVPSPDYVVRQGHRRDAAGEEYDVDIRVGTNGFRAYGDSTQTNTKKRLFIIGDSFTHALEVSDNKTYFAKLRDALPLEVFAYGAGGYGTLQEYLVLDQQMDTVKPDAVLLQYCFNDFINNSYELEVRSYYHNSGLRRPYLTPDGNIMYALPGGFPLAFPWLRGVANRHSRFLYFVFSRIDRATVTRRKPIERAIERQGVEHPLLRQSVQITDRLLKMIRARVPPEVKLCVFAVDNTPPYFESFIQLAHSNGFDVIEGVPEAIDKAERDGLCVRAADKAHWNELGHELAAGVLIHYYSNAWAP